MAEQKKRLGRGLNSLLSPTRYETVEPAAPQTPPAPQPQEQTINENIPTHSGEFVAKISLDKIKTNPHQPRFNWNDDKLQELSDSIKANGLVQPIIVREMDDCYQLIAGERRLRASQMAGFTDIKAIVKEATEEQMLEWALIENIHRDDLSPLERAKAYNKYITDFSLTQAEAAERIGEDRSNIANYMRLLTLPSDVQDLINQQKLGMGHARAILALPDPKQQSKVAAQIVKKELSVRAVEKLVKDIKNSANESEENITETNKKEKHPNIVELENEMTQALGTKVSIETKGKKTHQGKIIIDFYNLDDFDRLREILV